LRRIAYFPYAQQVEDVNGSNLLAEVRTSIRPELIAGQVQRQLKELDPSVLVRTEPLSNGIRDSLVTERVVTALSVFLGGAALLLATASLYGLLTYTVSQRTKEIGLRLALGADRVAVLWMVMSQSLFPLLAGLVFGVWASLSLGRFVENLLYGMTAKDSFGLTIAAAVVLSVALAASYIPARRAVRVDPMSALRHQ
jgi:ABC-type antimicrobial peptide transport system permease subunit